jgi:hypothetical protein
VYAGGAANAGGLTYLLAVRVPGPNTGWPVRLALMGFSPKTVPEFAVSPNTEMVEGIPDCTWQMVAKCQCSLSRRVQVAAAWAGMSNTLLGARRCHTSQAGPFSAARSLLIALTPFSNREHWGYSRILVLRAQRFVAHKKAFSLADSILAAGHDAIQPQTPRLLRWDGVVYTHKVERE